MKKLHYFLFIILLGCSSTKVTSNAKKSIIEIYFNDFFRNEKISLKLCECEIFKDVLINSNEIGYSGINVKGFLEKDFFFQYNKKMIPCKLCNTDNLRIEIILNNNNNNNNKIFIINIQKGKYIGFDKGKDGVVLTQQSTPFEYE